MITHEKSPEIFVRISGVPKFIPSILPASFFQLRSLPSTPERGASVSIHGTSPHLVTDTSLHCLEGTTPSTLSSPAQKLAWPSGSQDFAVSKCLQYFNSVLQRIRSHYKDKSCSYYTGLHSACPLSEIVRNSQRAMSRDSGHPNSSSIRDSSVVDNLGTESMLISKGEY